MKRDLKAELLNATLSISTSHDKGGDLRRGSNRWKKDIDVLHGRNKGDSNEYDVNKNTLNFRVSANHPKAVKSLTSTIVSMSGSNRSISTNTKRSIRSHSCDSRIVIHTNNIISHSNTPSVIVNSKSIKHLSNKIKISSSNSNVNSYINNIERTHMSSDSNRSSKNRTISSNGIINTSRTAGHSRKNKNNNNSSNSSNNNDINYDNRSTTSRVIVKVPDNRDNTINDIIKNGNSINGIINNDSISNNGSSTAVRMLRFKEPNRHNKTIIELEEELREKKRLLFELELRRIKNNIITQSAIHHVNSKQAKYQVEINRLEEGMNKAREQLEEGYIVAQL